MEQLKKVKK